MIRLVPMSDEEFRHVSETSSRHFVEGQMRAGKWDEEPGRGALRTGLAELLPRGRDTPGHTLRTIVDTRSGNRVGYVWYEVQPAGSYNWAEGERDRLWLHWIEIHEAFRRRGYATAALRWVDEEARGLGVGRVVLHVFGDNARARVVYERAGYRVTDLTMAKWAGP